MARKSAGKAEDVALLQKAMKGAPSGNPTDEEMADIVAAQKSVRKKLRLSWRAKRRAQASAPLRSSTHASFTAATIWNS